MFPTARCRRVYNNIHISAPVYKVKHRKDILGTNEICYTQGTRWGGGWTKWKETSKSDWDRKDGEVTFLRV